MRAAKSIDKFLEYYSDQFMTDGMNKKSWSTYKKRRIERADLIQIALSEVQIYDHGLKTVVRFMQNFRSGAKQDDGIKTLYLSHASTGFTIVGESWEQQLSDKSTLVSQGSSARENNL